MKELLERIKADFKKSDETCEMKYVRTWFKVNGFDEANKYLNLKWNGHEDK